MLSTQELTDRLAHLTRKYQIKKASLADKNLLNRLSGIKNEIFLRISKAICKINDQPEKYGICENCGEPIPLERLIILPEAELCIGCQRKEEYHARGHGSKIGTDLVRQY